MPDVDTLSDHSGTLSTDDHGVEIKAAGGGKAKGVIKLEKKLSSLGSSVLKNGTSRISRVLSLLPKWTHPSKFERINRPAAHALRGLKFFNRYDSGGWAAAEKRFNELSADTDGLLPCPLFAECLGMGEDSKGNKKELDKESKEIAARLFNALARRRNITRDRINKEEFKEFWDQISDQNFDSRLQTFFDLIDKDADGKLTEEEVRDSIILSASANKLSNIKKQADEYAALIMKELDPNNLGYIGINDLERWSEEASNYYSESNDDSDCQTRSDEKPIKEPNPLTICYRVLLGNWERVWVMALWIGAMAGLFAYKYVQYRNKAAYDVMGHCVCMAKGAAETLKLNMALILLPVCRNTITWLRNKTRLGCVVPFDDNFDFHKIIAVAIAIGVGIHAISHLACDFPRLLHASPEKYAPMEPFFGDQPSSYWHFVKGVEGVTGIIMVVLMAVSFTLATPWLRRSKLKVPKTLNKYALISAVVNKVTGFNAFWYSHHLFVIVYALLIVHGFKLYLTHDWHKKTTWMYIAIPMILYAGERLIRSSRSRIKPVKILKVGIYPGKVLALHLSKPQGFRYKSGQYIFVKCLDVSPFEWHPFSLTSAPGHDDEISVHIRSVGDWTGRIREVVSKAYELPLTGTSGLHTLDHLKVEKSPRVLIDGPYGAPAQDYRKYEVVLLMGLGIGATPMISIVKDILNSIKAKDHHQQNALENGSATLMKNATADNHFKARKAYFYWVTSEQESFEWFKGVMDEVAEMDQQGVIEIHNYCTSVYEEGDARSAVITMLQTLKHARNGVDVVSGTRVRCHFGRPDWSKVFQHVADNNTNSQVGVFYCGRPIKELPQLALEFSRGNTSTKFDFHTENF